MIARLRRVVRRPYEYGFINPERDKITFDDAMDRVRTRYSNNGLKSADHAERRITLHLQPFFGGRLPWPTPKSTRLPAHRAKAMSESFLTAFKSKDSTVTAEAFCLLADAIVLHTKELRAALGAVEQRLAELEQRGPSMKYAGTWENRADGYGYGETVTRAGSLWHSDANCNKSIPGATGSLWTLCVKRGKDAR